RIKSTFRQNVERFKAANENLLRREKESIARERAESGKLSSPQSNLINVEDEESVRLLPEDRLAQAQTLAVGHETIVVLEERELAIRQIETDILGLNEMFRDIGIMIQDQG
ncbi:hypothetical protein, partial [Salmonella sp. s54836]|uniref:hypothetical protein n=1 Tax=Salmonella sp. s54836 TaxID=3159673 RepID=UPI00397F2279